MNPDIKLRHTGQYVEITNNGIEAGPGRNNEVFAFLEKFQKRGAFLSMSAGPYASVHAIEVHRLPKFIKCAADHGLTAA